MTMTPTEIHQHIITFMSHHSLSGLSGSISEISNWETRLPKNLREQLMTELLGLGVNIACLRNKTNKKLEGGSFLTFTTDNKDLSESEAFKLMMMGFKESKMFIDIKFAD